SSAADEVLWPATRPAEAGAQTWRMRSARQCRVPQRSGGRSSRPPLISSGRSNLARKPRATPSRDEVHRLLRFARGPEDRLLVLLQRLQPALDIRRRLVDRRLEPESGEEQALP